VISHELRTPLNAITGYVDPLDLEVDGELTEGQSSRLDRIRIGARQLRRIIDHILVFVRSESDAFAVERLPLDLRALVGEVAELLRPRRTRKGSDSKRTWNPLRLAWIRSASAGS
jgi:signal transduction histidine kinase